MANPLRLYLYQIVHCRRFPSGDFSGTIPGRLLMKKIIYVTFILFSIVAIGETQGIPKQLWGKWRIRRELPTSAISCWGEKEAKAMIGTEIEYTAESFRWQKVMTEHASAKTNVVDAQQFQGPRSDVTFRQLGIKGTSATQITIDHPAAKITGATTEIPGDSVLIKTQNTIIVSTCNVYFEAERIAVPSLIKQH